MSVAVATVVYGITIAFLLITLATSGSIVLFIVSLLLLREAIDSFFETLFQLQSVSQSHCSDEQKAKLYQSYLSVEAFMSPVLIFLESAVGRILWSEGTMRVAEWFDEITTSQVEACR